MKYMDEMMHDSAGAALKRAALAAHKAGGGDQEYEKLYVYVRRELCRKTGADMANFRQVTKSAWEALSLSDDHGRDEVTKFLEQLMEVRTWVYMVGIRSRDNEEDRKAEMEELLDKVKSWSPIGKHWLYTDSRPTSFAAYESSLRSWINQQKPKGNMQRLPQSVVPEPKHAAKKVSIKTANLTVPGTESAALPQSGGAALSEFDKSVGDGDDGEWEYEPDPVEDGTMFVMSVNALRQLVGKTTD